MLGQYEDRLKNVLKEFEEEINLVECGSQIVQELQLALSDPELPFPKMRKEGVGAYCNSSFQFFLIDKKLGLEEPYLQDCFQSLKNYIEATR